MAVEHAEAEHAPAPAEESRSSMRVAADPTQDLARRLGRTYGNRRAARVLARLVDAAGLKKIAESAQKRGAIEAQHLVWELIHAYCPEKGFALAGSSYEPAVKGFRLDHTFTWLGVGKGVKDSGKTIVIGDDAVKRVAAGDVDTVGKELKQTLSVVTDPFRWLVLGVSLASAPTHVSLPLAAREGLEKAWAKSLPGTKSLEQGGILVQQNDEFTFKAGKAGTSGTFPFNRGDVKKGETLAAVAHTHPYSAKEGGFTDVSFSGQDLSLMVDRLERISIVRSGEGDFIVASSTEFEQRVTNAASKAKLRAEVKKFWTDQFNGATGNVPERARTATKATCLTFDLLYYEGKSGDLAQPRDMIDARKKATP